jgi:hypothetical protein
MSSFSVPISRLENFLLLIEISVKIGIRAMGCTCNLEIFKIWGPGVKLIGFKREFFWRMP